MPEIDPICAPQVRAALRIDGRCWLPISEIELTAIRAQGAGGQHVNTTSTAIQLRFDINASSLPQRVKHRLHAQGDRRLNRDGVLVIKSQEHRSQAMNRQAAIERLIEWIQSALRPVKPRIATRQPASVKRRRLQDKLHRSKVKKLRSRRTDEY